MTGQVTRCPSCDTSFVVTEAQLNAASGAVRCGACLEVFMAADYFIEAPIADLFAETEELEAVSFVEETDQASLDEEVTEISEELTIPDESEELEVEGEDFANVEEADTPSEQEFESSGPDESEVETAKVQDEEPETDAETAILEQVEQVEQETDQPVDLDQLDQALEQIIDEDIDPEYKEAPARNNLAWFCVSLLLSGALAIQFLWFEQDRFISQVEYRAYYEKLCNAIGCRIDPFSDVTYLKTNNLVVRTHPEDETGLVVDALLRNEAGFRQPFPGLYLRFADVSGKTIAERTFQPTSYLAGEMSGLMYIPASTEVRLSLEIVDPGPEAVSYSLVAVADP